MSKVAQGTNPDLDRQWGIRRRLETRTERMLKFIDMQVDPKYPNVSAWISHEADLIRKVLTMIENEWGNRVVADTIARADEEEANG